MGASNTESPNGNTAAEFQQLKQALGAKEQEINTINKKLQELSDTFVKKVESH